MGIAEDINSINMFQNYTLNYTSTPDPQLRGSNELMALAISSKQVHDFSQMITV